MSLDLEVENIEKDKNLPVTGKLDKISMLYVEEGYSFGLRTENQLQMVKKKKFSFLGVLLWSLLGFLLLILLANFVSLPLRAIDLLGDVVWFLWGLGLLLYILYYLTKKDSIFTIVFPKKNKEIKKEKTSTADELKKLSELVNQGLLTEDEFNTQKDKLLGTNT